MKWTSETLHSKSVPAQFDGLKNFQASKDLLARERELERAGIFREPRSYSVPIRPASHYFPPVLTQSLVASPLYLLVHSPLRSSACYLPYRSVFGVQETRGQETRGMLFSRVKS